MLEANQKVRINNGPLAGLAATVVRVSERTAAVAVRLDEGRRGWRPGDTATIERSGLTPIDAAPVE